MPLQKKYNISSGIEIGIWEITESVEELIGMLFLNKEEFDTLYAFSSEVRRKQWLSYRALIRNLVKMDTIYKIYYDEHNKPYLVNPARSISVSHSGKYSAALIDVDASAINGLDIEMIHPKILKVADKFLSAPEMNFLGKDPLLNAIILWSAKEAAFKFVGKQGVFMKEHIHILDYKPDEYESILMSVETEGQHTEMRIAHHRHEDLIITHTI